jgi:hypothetical protein
MLSARVKTNAASASERFAPFRTFSDSERWRSASKRSLMAKLAVSICGVAGLFVVPSLGASATQGPTAPAPSKFVDPTDGWLDVSGFLDTAYGFVPIAKPITEPAVGDGLAGGLVFIDRNPPSAAGGWDRPNLAMVGGFGTENDSKGGFAAHSGSWYEGRLETVVGIVDATLNLDFHGIGADSGFNDNPVRYRLEPLAALLEARYRIGTTRYLAGLRYLYSDAQVSFAGDEVPAEVDTREFNSKISGFEPAVTFDTRDNVFTPMRGNLAKIGVGIYDEAFGSSADYQNLSLTLLDFRSLGSGLTLGTNLSGSFSFGDVPFYVRPFVRLRGVEALRYAGGHAAQVECEVRWQCWGRFSVVGFAGAGVAWTNAEHFERKQEVISGGAGFRYELARSHKLHAGIDVAFGPDEPVWYVIFGGAWFRP